MMSSITIVAKANDRITMLGLIAAEEAKLNGLAGWSERWFLGMTVVRTLLVGLECVAADDPDVGRALRLTRGRGPVGARTIRDPTPSIRIPVP